LRAEVVAKVERAGRPVPGKYPERMRVSPDRLFEYRSAILAGEH
jgi:hypothetical protein